jgi:hypothetical protein
VVAIHHDDAAPAVGPAELAEVTDVSVTSASTNAMAMAPAPTTR